MTLNFYQSANSDRVPVSKISITQIIKAALANRGRAMMQFLSVKREPVILQRFDRKGCPYWEIHDLATGQNYYCLTKTEVLIWLETRYR